MSEISIPALAVTGPYAPDDDGNPPKEVRVETKGLSKDEGKGILHAFILGKLFNELGAANNILYHKVKCPTGKLENPKEIKKLTDDVRSQIFAALDHYESAYKELLLI